MFLRSGGSMTLSVTDGCRWPGGDRTSMQRYKAPCCSILLTHGNFTNLADAFTGNIGHPQVEKQVAAVTALMRVSPD